MLVNKMRLLLLLAIVALAGCANNPDKKGLMETLEFGEDECGCFRGNVNIAPSVFTGTNVNAVLHKRKACPGEEQPPAC